jgi:hypothetical protein
MSATSTVLDGDAAVRAAVGSELGISEWLEITPQRIDDFIAATGVESSAYFAIGLSNKFLPEIVEVRGFALGVNYGTQLVQFGEPLRAGDRVRARAHLTDVVDVKNGIQTTMLITVECSRETDDVKPCVIESLSRWLNPGG